MESSIRTQSNLTRIAVLIGAVVGTALLAFVPSAAWLDLPLDGDPYLLMSVYMLKEALTVLQLLIVPALWARSAHRFGVWTLLFLAAVSFGTGYALTKSALDAFYTLLLAALPGVGLWALQKLHLNNFRTVLYTSVLTLFALFAYVCLPSYFESGNAYLPFKNVIVFYERMIEDLQPAAAALGGSDTYTTVLALVTELKLSPDAIGVPILCVPAMTAGLSNVLFSHLFNRRGGADLIALPPFSEWRCERLYVYLTMGFALVTYALSYFDISGIDALASIAMLVFTMPCALAGLSSLRRLSLRLKKGWLFVIFCIAPALMPSFGMTLLSVIGMIASIRTQTTDRKDGTVL